MNISLEDVKSLEAETPCKRMIHVKILEKGAVTRYKKDGKQDRMMSSVIIADKTASMKGLVYDLGNLEMMHIKSGVKIQDFIPKRE